MTEDRTNPRVRSAGLAVVLCLGIGMVLGGSILRRAAGRDARETESDTPQKKVAVKNLTRSFEIVSWEVLPVKENAESLNSTKTVRMMLRNRSHKRVTAYCIEKRCGAWRNRKLVDLSIADPSRDFTLGPGAEVEEVVVFPDNTGESATLSGPALVTVCAVVLDDDSGEGAADQLASLLNQRLGYKTQAARIVATLGKNVRPDEISVSGKSPSVNRFSRVLEVVKSLDDADIRAKTTVGFRSGMRLAREQCLRDLENERSRIGDVAALEVVQDKYNKLASRLRVLNEIRDETRQKGVR